MTESYLTNPAVFLVQTLFGLYILAVMLRLLLQWVRADFYNPVSQFIVKLTHPVLRPMRRFVPPLLGLDMASLLLAWLLKTIEIGIVLLLMGFAFPFWAPLLWAIPALLELTIDIFLFAIIMQAILSWFSSAPYNPVNQLLHSLTQPILSPAQRLIPPIAGVDLSPMVAIIALYLLEMLLMPPLRLITGMPQGI
ncbi:MAG: YggT family protein [Gammaproteobacteria bacterium]|nr:YggT family protein [Gammaproteobacteria bacterium]MBU1655862.1 YggT family protein [Gammaproteobacteria bacterium]MBU1960605.1 YggT family protein [Gammaproteobacteria bacterium]